MDRNVNGGSNAARGQSRRERRREEERFRIIRAAERVYRERGFAAAGMREIAAEADLSPANLYHYFSSKEELLFFCQDRALDRLQVALEVARNARGPVDGRLHDFAVAHVLCLIDDAEGSAAHFEVDALSPELRARIAAKRARYKDGLRALIALGMRRGELRRADPMLAMRGFSGALNWTAHWYRPGSSHSAQQVAEQIADFAVAGLTARTPRATRRRAADRGADGLRRSRNGVARDPRDGNRRPPGTDPGRREPLS
jgi:AcrR family transcriptional regulator